MVWAGAALLRLGEVVTWGLNASELKEAGSAPEALDGAEVLLLPMPASRKPGTIAALGEELPLEETLAALQPGTLVLAGMPDARLRKLTEEKGCRVLDYSGRREITIPGAAATAEGALSELIQHTESTLRDSRILVLGAGRIGLRLLRLLDALGAETAMYARGERDRERIDAMGWSAVSPRELVDVLATADALVNTVPQRFLDHEILEKAAPGTLYLELASSPGGVDPAELKALGLRYQAAPGIPGRTAPKSSGEAVARAVMAILRERGTILYV